MATLKTMMDYAKNNPNDPRNTKLREFIKRGDFDEEARNEGIDLTGKSESFNVIQEETNTVENVMGLVAPQTRIFNSIANNETLEDARQAFTGITNTFRDSSNKIQEIADRDINREQSGTSTVIQGAGQGIQTGLNVVGELFKGIVKVALPQEQEEKVKQFLTDSITAYGDINVQGKTVEQSFNELNADWEVFAEQNPELSNNLVAGRQIVEGLVDAVTGGQVGNVRRAGGEVVEQAIRQVDDVASSVTRNVDDVISQFKQVRDVSEEVPVTPKPSTIEEALKDTATGITEENANIAQKSMSDELLTVRNKKRLLGIDGETGNRYIDALEASEIDDTARPVFDLTTEDTQKVFNEFENINRQTGSEIGKIKEKINTLPVDKPKIQTVIDDVDAALSRKGLRKNDIGEYEIITGSNSPFSTTDVKNINNEIVQVLENINNASTNEQLILGMESLSNKINFNLSTDISGSLQGLSKKTNAQLKEIRDSLLTPEEASKFNDYSKAKELVDEFKKSDNKIKTLINREDSMRSGDLQKVAQTLKDATGKDIRDYTRLMKILIEASPANGVNRSLLSQRIGEGAELGAELMTGRPLGVLTGVLKNTGKQFFNVDMLKEIKKAIDFVPTKTP